MNKLLIAIALPTALAAQQNTGMAFQNAIVTGDGAGTVKVMTRYQVGRAVVGRPITALEEHHSLQVLGDGTRIESKTTDKFYRDGQGRTRVEHEDGTVLIEDPVQGARAEYKPGKTVTRSGAFSTANTQKFYFSTTTGNGDLMQAKLAAEAAMPDRQVTLVARRVATTGATADKQNADKQNAEAASKAETRKEEDLGVQILYGTAAHGTRTTITIPIGQIGNDRPINIISESWYSTDLQMLVKSVNNDPRFGENTYELTNIVPGAPDPSLFQLPADSHQ